MIQNELSSEQIAKFRKNLNENLETRDRDLEAIKKWLLEQPHLPNSWVNEDRRLLNFLRGCHFSTDLCKKKLDKYFTVRSAYPELFSNRDIQRPVVQEIFQIADCCILPRLTSDGKRVSLLRAGQQDFETPDLEEAFKIIFMVGDIRLDLEETTVGDIYIFDINFNLAKHFFHVSLLLLRKVFICIQEAYPVIVKEVHILNAPAYIAFIINVIKPFLNEDIRNCIRVHTNIETLYDFVPKDILPVEYGGRGKTVAEYKRLLISCLEDYGPWFREQEDVKSDESKRPLKSRWWFSTT